MNNRLTHSTAASREAGFSIFELLVGLAVMAQVIVVILLLFDVNNKVARVQTSVSDLQQSQRIAQHELVRYVRMAGRGGLRAPLALEFTNNVDNTTRQMSPTVTDNYLAMVGSDVLTVRGVINTPIFQVDAVNPASLIKPPGTPPMGEGTLIINSPSPSGVPQDLQVMLDADQGDALLLVSSVDDSIFAVVEVKSVNGDTSTVTITFDASGTTNSDAYRAKFGGYPNDLTAVAFAGLLEEYRFYAREAYPVGTTGTITELQPKLTQARFYPGTTTAWDSDDTNLGIDIAENIVDLQLALGIDTDRNRVIDSTSAIDRDEWLFNDASETTWSGNNPGCAGTCLAWNAAPLHYLRISTLARGATPEASYISPPIARIENRIYNEKAGTQSMTSAERMPRLYRRRQLQTQVDLRNLG